MQLPPLDDLSQQARDLARTAADRCTTVTTDLIAIGTIGVTDPRTRAKIAFQIAFMAIGAQLGALAGYTIAFAKPNEPFPSPLDLYNALRACTNVLVENMKP